LVLLITGFSAGIALALVRRSMRDRVKAARLAAMGMATGRILHQVKNPLQTILLHAEMLEDESLISDPGPRREVSQAIIGEALRMTELLGVLSNYASGIARRLELSPSPLDELVRAVAEQAAQEGEREGVRVVLGRLEPVVVDADPGFLRQALEHVVRNAREAVRERAYRTDDGRVEIALRRRRSDAVVEIRDNGPGIEPERLDQIIDPFVTTKPRALGLGLAITREIIEAHGGRIELRSRPGAGLTVSLILPLAAAPRPLQAA